MSKINLKKGDTMQAKINGEVLQLYFEQGKYIVQRVTTGNPRLFVFYTQKSAKEKYSEILKEINHKKAGK